VRAVERLLAGAPGLQDAIRHSDFPAVRFFGHNLKGERREVWIFRWSVKLDIA